MGEAELAEVVTAVDPVNDLQRAVGILLAAALVQPAHELGGLFGEADPQQGVEREGGVADPGVAVVPVAHPADILGQATGGRGDDGAGRLVGEELERQGRAVNRLTPAAGVGASREPVAPEVDRSAEQLELLHLRQAEPAAALADLAEHEDHRLPLLQPELGGDPRPVATQRNLGRQAEAEPGGDEAGAFRRDGRVVLVPRVVEGRPALDAEGHRAADDLDAPDQPVRAGLAVARIHRHVIDDLAYAVGREESGD